MRLVLMCLAFIATVLLILSLYPSVTAKFIGSAESASGNPAEAREKMIRFSYPLIIFSVIFSGLLFLGINLLLTFIASLVCGILFYAAVARVLTAQKRKKSAIFEEHMLDFLVLVSSLRPLLIQVLVPRLVLLQIQFPPQHQIQPQVL